MKIRRQDLVNAQTEINRAVWAMNIDTKKNGKLDVIKRAEPTFGDSPEARDQYIVKCANAAIKDLNSALGRK